MTHPPSPRPAAPAPCTWLTDRIPLTGRVGGRHRLVWALHAAGHPDTDIAAHLHVPPATVTAALRSLYRALALDADDPDTARVQARQLYRAALAGPGTPPGPPS